MDAQAVDVLIYSANSETRQAVIEGTGVRPGRDSARLNWIETATAAGALKAVADHQPPIVVLDAETPKVGGMAVAQDIRNELELPVQPVVILLTARPQDHWLATWSGAAFTIQAPYDPLELQETMVEALKSTR
ncbi:hypothetical protein [Actinomyces minihominis]|uniref:hypothetical protein n=1 Tax=Actinomyces minihominis TaxID=2002838 RepID=UPI000C074E6C|nr:hypothetical protein [Actinomyces minihominis]